MATSYDVIVVGVGAMGAAACYHLARRDARVLGLEQFDIPHALGSSHGHTRMIRMAYYEHPDYVPLLRRAYELWRELERASGQSLLFETGGIYMGPPGGQVVGGAAEAARLHGLDHELLSAQLAERFPQFTVPDDYTGIWEPRAGFVLSEKAIATHAELALRAGAELHGRERVTDWNVTADGVIVRTDRDGEYRARRLLFCGGAWTDRLVRNLGVGLVVTRQPLAWVWPREPERFGLWKLPVWGIEQADGSLAYGFPMLGDVPGLKLARHGRGPISDPDTISRNATADDFAEIARIVANHYPSASGPVLSMRICMYTNSPDGHFILDRHPQFERVHIACGFSGHGFKFATVVGEVLADLVTLGRTGPPIGFLGLRRFS